MALWLVRVTTIKKKKKSHIKTVFGRSKPSPMECLIPQKRGETVMLEHENKSEVAQLWLKLQRNIMQRKVD
jgi:hypothetical protein